MVLRCQCGTERRVRNLLRKEPTRIPLDGPRGGAVPERCVQQLAQHVDCSALDALSRGHAREQALAPLWHRGVATRQDPRWRTLKQVELSDLRLDLRHELDSRRAGSDHGNPLSVQVDGVIPLRRMEHRSAERAQPGDRRQRRVAQWATRHHQRATGPLVGGGGDGPLLRTLIPCRAEHVLRVGEMPLDIELRDTPSQVGPDLSLRRKRPAPPRVGRERKGIERRLHVACAPGIGVVAPRTASLCGAFEDHEIVDPALAQRDREADSRESAADDHQSCVRRQFRSSPCVEYHTTAQGGASMLHSVGWRPLPPAPCHAPRLRRERLHRSVDR